MGTPSTTALAQLGYGTGNPVTSPLNFSSFDPGYLAEQRDLNGVRGTFFRDTNRVRTNRITVAPRLSTEPTSAELPVILQLALWGTPSGSGNVSYPIGNTPYTVNLNFKPIAGDQWFLGNCTIDSLTLSSSAGEPLRADCDMVGQTGNTTNNNFPANLTYDASSSPFIMTDLSLTIAGVSYSPRSLSVNIANRIDRGRYLNSLTLTRINKLDQVITATVEIPSTDATSMYANATGELGGANITAIYLNPNTSARLYLSMPAVIYPPKSADHPMGGEGFLTLSGTAYRASGAGASLVCTLQS